MNYKLLVLGLLLPMGSNTLAQNILERQVVSNNGVTLSGNGVIFQQTIGQIAIKTLESPTITMTQGFQQSELNIIAAKDIAPDLNLTFFPNPTTTSVKYKVERGEFENAQLYLYASNGQFILSAPFSNQGGEFDLSALADGSYLLQLKNNNVISKSFQIIKLTK